MPDDDGGRIERLAAHYDAADLSGEIDAADHDARVEADPMITTSLRLPKSLLDDVRVAAADAGLRPTQLLRRWIERAVLESQARTARHVDVVHQGGSDRAGLVELLAEMVTETIARSREESRQLVRDAVHAELAEVRELLERRAAG